MMERTARESVRHLPKGVIRDVRGGLGVWLVGSWIHHGAANWRWAERELDPHPVSERGEEWKWQGVRSRVTRLLGSDWLGIRGGKMMLVSSQCEFAVTSQLIVPACWIVQPQLTWKHVYMAIDFFTTLQSNSIQLQLRFYRVRSPAIGFNPSIPSSKRRSCPYQDLSRPFYLRSQTPMLVLALAISADSTHPASVE